MLPSGECGDFDPEKMQGCPRAALILAIIYLGFAGFMIVKGCQIDRQKKQTTEKAMDTISQIDSAKLFHIGRQNTK
ncbi:MAG: hypothetical protein J5620_01670 [Alphaproteobacteria bacterium]|nr:hypothetical protein [Alphaproteobacteria bacterium]